MGIFSSLKFSNPFSKTFKDNQRFEKEILDQIANNSYGVSDAEIEIAAHSVGMATDKSLSYDVFSTNLSFNVIYSNKKNKIGRYRDMALYPEIGESLDIICDESVVQDSNGKIVHLNIKKEIPKSIERDFKYDFEYITEDVLNVKDNLYDLFWRWLVEGELYIENVLNDKKNKIIGYKVLPAFTMYPLYDKDGFIKKYIQSVAEEGFFPTNLSDTKTFESNQINYVNWGKYGSDGLQDVRGFLEHPMRTYNQLRNLEDSLIVYRLVRAPERRIWNIEVGKLPKTRAEEHIKQMIMKYKRKMSYNADSGTVDATRSIHSLAEDFWFAKRDGQGTTVDTLQSGMNLGELTDVNYFLQKLYKTLKIPRTRWDRESGGSTYNSGRELDRDELKFTLFTNRIQNKFKKIIKNMFLEHIRFKYGSDEKYKKYLKNTYFDITFTPSNFFKTIKEMELMEARMNLLATAQSFVVNEMEPNNPLSQEYTLREIFKMSDEEYELNESLKKKEKQKRNPEEKFFDDENENKEKTSKEIRVDIDKDDKIVSTDSQSITDDVLDLTEKNISRLKTLLENIENK